MKKILAVICLGLTGFIFSAQSALITFDFTGTAPGQNSPWTSTSSLDPNLTLTTGFSFGSGVGGGNANNRFAASGWTTPGTATLADSISANDFVYFVITPNAGYSMDLNSATVTFTLQATSSGPNSYALLDSINGFTSGLELQSGSGITNATTGLSYTYDATGNNNITGPVEFRIYGFDASSGSGQMSVNAFSLGGTLTPVPEPAVWGAISGAGLLALCGLRFWREQRA